MLKEQWDRIFEIMSAKLKKLLILNIPLEIRLMIYMYHSSIFLFLWVGGGNGTYTEKYMYYKIVYRITIKQRAA